MRDIVRGWSTATPPTGEQVPYGGTAAVLPGTVEAERFDEGGEGVAYHDADASNNGGAFRSTGVDISGSGSQFSIGWVESGEWLEYTVDVQSAGTYELGFRVATPNSGSAFRLEVDGADVTGRQSVPVTGGWGTWTDLIVGGVALTAGEHVLRFAIEQASFNFDHITFNRTSVPPSGRQPYGGTAAVLPGTVEAERFDEGGEGVAYHDADASNNGGAFRSTAVDLEASTEGGYNVGWTEAGEWLEYTVDVETAGTYDVTFRVASELGGGAFHLEVDGADVTGRQSVGATGGWQAWTDVAASGVRLSAGQRVLRLAVEQGPFNLNSITVTAANQPPTSSAVTVRARGNCGGEDMRLKVGDNTVATWYDIGSSLTSNTYSSYSGGNIKVEFFGDANDGCDRNLFVDYIQVGSTTYQTENSATRTGCGDGQWLWCNGYFDFGSPGVSGAAKTATDVEEAGRAGGVGLGGQLPEPVQPVDGDRLYAAGGRARPPGGLRPDRPPRGHARRCAAAGGSASGPLRGGRTGQWGVPVPPPGWRLRPGQEDAADQVAADPHVRSGSVSRNSRRGYAPHGWGIRTVTHCVPDLPASEAGYGRRRRCARATTGEGRRLRFLPGGAGLARIGRSEHYSESRTRSDANTPVLPPPQRPPVRMLGEGRRGDGGFALHRCPAREGERPVHLGNDGLAGLASEVVQKLPQPLFCYVCPRLFVSGLSPRPGPSGRRGG